MFLVVFEKSNWLSIIFKDPTCFKHRGRNFRPKNVTARSKAFNIIFQNQLRLTFFTIFRPKKQIYTICSAWTGHLLFVV